MQIGFSNISTILTIAGTALGGLGSAYVGLRQLINGRERDKKKQFNALLQAAKDNDAILKQNLEAKIHDLENSLNSMGVINKQNMEFLADKIEDLRKQLNDDHVQLLTLLTKLIGK
jgi:hypothetical protein